MRLWSLHPKYLDTKGLVALWREALLAQKVLEGKTKGYTNHPQLNRFKESNDPVYHIGCYLSHVFDEAQNRGFKFNRVKIIHFSSESKLLTVTSGQLEFELGHLLSKLERRDFERFKRIKLVKIAECHPIFKVIKGDVQDWEKIR
jgi:hypothetical protein